MYVLGQDALTGNLEDCIVGGLWSAHSVMLFMVFSVELLSVFVPADQQVNHPCIINCAHLAATIIPNLLWCRTIPFGNAGFCTTNMLCFACNDSLTWMTFALLIWRFFRCRPYSFLFTVRSAGCQKTILRSIFQWTFCDGAHYGPHGV
jgi:hypothetical protein